MKLGKKQKKKEKKKKTEGRRERRKGGWKKEGRKERIKAFRKDLLRTSLENLGSGKCLEGLMMGEENRISQW